MDQSPILKEQSVDQNPNQIRTENTNSSFAKKSRNMYVLNLDGSRIFWILSIVLLLMTFVLLLGYWIGSDATVTAAEANGSQITRSGVITTPTQTAPAQTTRSAERSSQTTITEEPISRNAAGDSRSIVDTTQPEPRNSTATPDTASTRNNEQPSAGHSNSAENTEQTAGNSTESESAEAESSTNTTRNNIAQRVRRLRTRRGIDTVGSDKFMTTSKPFSIQIATHFSLRMAMSVKKQLRNKNHSAYIFMHNSSSGKKFYKIRVGAFSSREGAKKYLALLKRNGLGKRSIIVHR